MKKHMILMHFVIKSSRKCDFRGNSGFRISQAVTQSYGTWQTGLRSWISGLSGYRGVPIVFAGPRFRPPWSVPKRCEPLHQGDGVTEGEHGCSEDLCEVVICNKWCVYILLHNAADITTKMCFAMVAPTLIVSKTGIMDILTENVH